MIGAMSDIADSGPRLEQNARLAALQQLTELDEELGLPRKPDPHSNQSEVSVRPAIDSELVQ